MSGDNSLSSLTGYISFLRDECRSAGVRISFRGGKKGVMDGTKDYKVSVSRTSIREKMTYDGRSDLARNKKREKMEEKIKIGEKLFCRRASRRSWEFNYLVLVFRPHSVRRGKIVSPFSS